MTLPPRCSLKALLASIAGVCAFALVGASSRAADDHFEKRVRPVLVERCYKCHAGEEVKGDLRFDGPTGWRRDADFEPVLVPGKPDESLLILAIRHEKGLKMPPDGKLPAAQIADIEAWVKAGADWPNSNPGQPSAAPASRFPPAIPPNKGDLANSLQLWLRADTLPLADGEPVHVWPDQSGRGRDVAATKGVRTDGVGLPGKFVKESTLMRRPAVRFETATGLAASPGNPVEIKGDAALSMTVVVNLQSHEEGSPHHGILGIGDPANTSVDPGRPHAALLQINRTEDQAFHFAGGWNHDASLGNGSFKPLYGQSIILTVMKTPGPMRTTTRVFINGELAAVPGKPLEGRDTVPEIRHRADIGAYLGKAVSWAGSIRGDVGEAIVYNKALSESERLGVEGYLAEKFGLSLRPLQAAVKAKFTAAEKSHWAYQPVKDGPPPNVKSTLAALSPVDQFIFAALETKGLSLSPPAERAVLLRRVTFDLTGLPPSPEEVEAFLGDSSPQAFEKVVDRLLASPHYGERWGRHWLDVVRYAETTANDANAVMRYAWRYRNYVIDAFNRDLPYDQFIVEQLAGDLLPPTPSAETNARRLIATGYLMVGAKALAETDKEQSRLDIVDDQIDVTGRAFLGLTVACARCHDHKFDAIRAVDYYAMAGILRGAEPFQDENRNATMWWEFPIPAGGLEPIMVMAPKESLPRNLRIHLRGNRFTLGPTAPRGFLQILEPHVGNAPRGVLELSTAPSSPPGPERHGGRSLQESSAPVPIYSLSSSGRLELAQLMAHRDNPLAARVMVNRIWQHHFGRGLVATSDNFGVRGELPTHPELLDWLAARLMESGWSVKAIHRQILLSGVYQQSGSSNPAARRADPDNRWLSSFPRRRLSAEELRDAVLAVSGNLDRQAGSHESGEFLYAEAEVIDAKRNLRPNRVGADHPYYTQFSKRSVYLPIVRNMLPDVLTLFDGADPNGVTAVRNDTTVPSQSLFLLNSPFLRDQARQLAQRLAASSQSTEQRIDEAHRLAFSRRALPAEIREGQEFLTAYAAATPLSLKPEAERFALAWQSYCQMLFCANEFLYVE